MLRPVQRTETDLLPICDYCGALYGSEEASLEGTGEFSANGRPLPASKVPMALKESGWGTYSAPLRSLHSWHLCPKCRKAAEVEAGVEVRHEYKGGEKVDPLDKLIRKTVSDAKRAGCGMTVGTVLRIEFISDFELFNTRAYHNSETRSQGYRVTGLGISIDREDLDEAIRDWAEAVDAKRAGEDIPACRKLMEQPDSDLPPDWIEAKQ